MRAELAMIEILYKGHVAPLTHLDFARDGQPGKFDGGVYYYNGQICEAGRQIKGSYWNDPASYLESVPAEKLLGNHIFGGMLQNEHFGHFVAESLTRLWATRQLHKSFDSVVFYLRVPSQPIAKFALDMLASIIPGVKITVVSRPTEYETLAVPKQLGDDQQGFIYGHPANRRLFAHLYETPKGGPKKIYVSRSHLKSNEGGVLLESVIEDNLKAEGYEIVHPQEFPFAEQIKLYRTAEDLIFSEGSALHLYAIFARPEQRSFVIWRRKKHGTFDWQLKSFGAQSTQGVPCIQTLWTPEMEPTVTVRGRAVLDFVSLRNQLQAAGFIRGAEWRVPTKSEFESELGRAGALMKTGFVKCPHELIGPNLLV
jgi:hypothetical protein